MSEFNDCSFNLKSMNYAKVWEWRCEPGNVLYCLCIKFSKNINTVAKG